MTNRTREAPADRMGYGRPWHLLSDEERAAQNPDYIYANSLWDYQASDMTGRRVADQPRPTQGPHQPFPGLPIDDD